MMSTTMTPTLSRATTTPTKTGRHQLKPDVILRFVELLNLSFLEF